MTMSGRSTSSNEFAHDDNGVIQDLPVDAYELLVDVYRKSSQRYSDLFTQYEEELRKAANRRQKSCFPPFSEWIPRGGLQSGDLELLRGPDKHAVFHKKITLKDKNTGRLIVYAAAKDEIQHPKYSCSYAQMLGHTHPPRLGQIKLCFTHTFLDQTRKFVVFSIFKEPQLDEQSKMWWVREDQTIESDVHVIELSFLSSPLVVAKEDCKLWFLTVNA